MLLRSYCLLFILIVFLTLKPGISVAYDDGAISSGQNTLNEDADQHQVGTQDSSSWWPPATPNDARARIAREKTAQQLQAKMREMNEAQQREAKQLQAQRMAQLRQMEDAERQRLAAAAQRERDLRDAQERRQGLLARQQVEAHRQEEARRLAEKLAADRRAEEERQLAARRFAASQQADLARQAEMEEDAQRQQEENRQAEDGMVHWRVKYGSGWHHAAPQDMNMPPPSHPNTNIGAPGYGISDQWTSPQNEGGSVNGKPQWSSPHDIRLSRPVAPAADGMHDVGEEALPPISRASREKKAPALGALGATGAASSAVMHPQQPSPKPPENTQFPLIGRPEQPPEEPVKSQQQPKRWHPNYHWRRKGLMNYKVGSPAEPPVDFSKLPQQTPPAQPTSQTQAPDVKAAPSAVSGSSSQTGKTAGEAAGSALGAAGMGDLAKQASGGHGAAAPHKQRKHHHRKQQASSQDAASPAPSPQESVNNNSSTAPGAAPPSRVSPSSASKEGAASSLSPLEGVVKEAPRVPKEAPSGEEVSQRTPAGVAVDPQQQKVLHDLIAQERAMLNEAKHPHMQPPTSAPVIPPPPPPTTNEGYHTGTSTTPHQEVPAIKSPAPLLRAPRIPSVPRPVAPKPAAVHRPPPALRVPRPLPKMKRGFGHHADDRIMPKAVSVGAPAAPPEQPAYTPPATTQAPAIASPSAPVRAPQARPAAPTPTEIPPAPMEEQKVSSAPTATFHEPEPAPPARSSASVARQPAYRPVEQSAAPAVATGASEAARYSTPRPSRAAPPPPQPVQQFTPASPAPVTSQMQAPPPGYERSPGRLSAPYPTESAQRTAALGAYHPRSAPSSGSATPGSGTGSSSAGTGTAGGMRHGIFAAGRVMGVNHRAANVLDLPGHWEGAVAALTGDAWSVIQTHRDPFFYGEPEDRTPAGQPLCHMVKVDGESTLDFSTSPAHELGGHVWDVDLHNAGLISRPGVVVPVTMRSQGSHGAPLTLSGVQSSGTLRIADLNNEAAARIARLFTQSQRVTIATDQGQYDVDTSGFGKGNARHAFTYCLAQDLSSDPAFYDAAPEGMKFVHEGAR